MANPSKPSWRKEAGRTPTVSPGTGKGWQSRKTRASDSAVAGHRLKLIGLGLLVVALGVAFAVAALWKPLATPLIVATVVDYNSPLPPNSFSQEDVERLTATNPENIRVAANSAGKTDRASFLEQFQNQFNRAVPGGPTKNVILLYISAHGLLDGNGEPCLLLSDSSPTAASSWLKVSELFEILKQRPNVKKILFIDAGRIDELWPAGVLYNGFAEQLEQTLTAAKIPNLFVMNATSPGERTWTGPEIGGSVFGYYVAQGLQGAASTNDNKVTLRELSDYVSRQVARHVRDQRASSQNPRLITPITAEQDFAIAYTAGASPPALPSAANNAEQLVARWQSIHEHWRKLENGIEERNLLRDEPLLVAQAQRELLRMEQLLLAGKAYTAELDAAESRLRVLLDFDARRTLPDDVNLFSLALQKQLYPTAKPDPKLPTLLSAWRAAGGKPPLKKDDPPPPALEYQSAAELAVAFAVGENSLRYSQFRDILGLLSDSRPRINRKGERVPDFVELHFQRMLERYVDRPGQAAEFTPQQQQAIRSALSLHSAAEEAAAPADVRVHLWTQTKLNELDALRRQFEDRLFCDSLGDPNQANQLSTTYAQIADRGKKIAESYTLRDEVWSGLPHLAAWVLRNPGITTVREGEVPYDKLVASVETLALRNIELARMLEPSLVEGQLDGSSINDEQVNEIRTAWRDLRGAFVAYCQELKDRGTDDKPTLREISEVLRVPSPLLAADERERLATIYARNLFDLAPTNSSSSSASSESANSNDSPTSLKTLAGYSVHPAVQILDRSQFTLLLKRREPEAKLEREGANDIAWLSKQGERVRKWLADVPQAARDLEDDTKTRLKESKETPANIRAGVSEADRLVRAAASLVDQTLDDPAVALRRVDWHLLLLWHARRTLDDFWGPSPDADPGAKSYFAEVTEGYLEAARAFDDTPTSPTYQNVNLRDLLSARLAAIQSTKLEPHDVRTLGDSPTASQEVHIQWHADLPKPGVASFFLEGSSADGQPELIPIKDRDSRDWRRQSLNVNDASTADLVHQIPTSMILNRDELTATLFYRGHLIRRPFEIGKPEAVLVANVDPRLPPNAKVTVRGQGNRRAFITFIVDCSGSMETIDNGVKRMDAAKDALFKVLDSLALERNYFVGLRAYSHRYKWISRGGKLVAVDRQGQPAAGDPDRDVQILVPIDRLTPEQHSQIVSQARSLNENGVTPLYYSILNALLDEERDFRFADADDIRHIIVITDGINQEQFKHTSAAEVLRVIDQDPRAAGKTVDVVLFQEQAVLRSRPAGGANVRQELADIKRIAEKTGGHYFAADDPDRLVEAIRNALKLVKFSATPVGSGEVPSSQQKDFGIDQVLEVPANKPTDYVVQLHPQSRVQAKQIRVEGGEAIELEYDKTQDQLVFPRYEPGDGRPLPGEFVDLVTRDRYSVTPLLPKKSLSRVAFEIAIQNTDPTKFTRRPKNIWVEIEPRAGKDRPLGTPYTFYDAQFAKQTPVPVLQFAVEDWPNVATQAAVRMWFGFNDPPLKPNGVATVKPIKPEVIEEDIPNVSFTAELIQIGQASRDWRLVVTEKHDRNTNLFTARVQATPTPARIGHRFFVGVDEVRHEFDYVGEAAPNVIVTSRERIIEQAVVVPQFILEVKE